MADRYWVGGTNTWNSTPGTKWATTSGGAGGALAPTSADDVFIDASSGLVTVSLIAGSVACRSLNCTAFIGTLSMGASSSLSIGDSIAGSSNNALIFSTEMIYTYTAVANTSIHFVSTSATIQIITTNGKSITSTFFDTAGNWKISDNFTTAGAVTLNAGTFDTNNQICIWGSFVSSNAIVRILTLGSSAVSLTGGGTVWNTTNTTNLTITANTSVITTSVVSVVFTSGILNMNGSSLVFNGPGIVNMNCTLTLANLTRTGTALKTDGMICAGNNIVTGTLTLNGNSVTNRLLIASGAGLGVQRTLTAAIIIASNTDFQDIVGAGAANWNLSSIVGGSGDALGNSGIIFTTSTAQTWLADVAGSWSDSTKWTSRVPLPQDDVVFPTLTARIITCDMPRIGRNVTWGAGTGTWLCSINFNMYGNLILQSGIILSGTIAIAFLGRGLQTLTMGGAVFVNQSINFGGFGGVYTLQDNFVTQNTISTTLNSLVTFNANGFNITALQVIINNLTTVNMGSGTWTLTATTAISVWSLGASCTVNGSSATIILSTASSLTRSFSGQSKSYGTLTYTVLNSPGTLTITGTNSFDTLNIGSGRVVTFPSSVVTNINNWNVAGQVNGYQRITGVIGQYASVPDSSALSITGDIDLRCKVSLDTWTPTIINTLIGKYGPNQISYLFSVLVSGQLRFIWSPDGPGVGQRVATSTVITGLALKSTSWVRVTLQVNNGLSAHVVKFYTSIDGITWSLLGTPTNSGPGTTSIFDGTESINIGSYATGTLELASGNFYRAQIRNNILDDGTGIVLDADFTQKTVGADSFIESSVNTAIVSITGDTARAGDGRVIINSLTPGTQAVIARSFDDGIGNKIVPNGSTTIFNSDNVQLSGVAGNYLSSVDTLALSVTGDIDIRIKVALSDWTPLANNMLLSKDGTINGYKLWVNTLGFLFMSLSQISPTIITVSSTISLSTVDGQPTWIRATWRQSDGRVQFFTADPSKVNPIGSDWIQLGADRTIALVSIIDNSMPIELGSYLSGAQAVASGKFYRAQIRNNILDNGTGIVFDFDAGQPYYSFQSDYLVIKDSKVGGSAKWHAGSHSISDSNNAGWNFIDDITPPITDLQISSGSNKISRVPTKDLIPLTISTTGEQFSEYQLRKVPAADSLKIAGTLIETALVSPRTSLSISLTDDELIDIAGGTDGNNIIKAFTKDGAGNWSI
jgi:hypothetical protein